MEAGNDGKANSGIEQFMRLQMTNQLHLDTEIRSPRNEFDLDPEPYQSKTPIAALSRPMGRNTYAASSNNKMQTYDTETGNEGDKKSADSNSKTDRRKIKSRDGKTKRKKIGSQKPIYDQKNNTFYIGNFQVSSAGSKGKKSKKHKEKAYEMYEHPIYGAPSLKVQTRKSSLPKCILESRTNQPEEQKSSKTCLQNGSSYTPSRDGVINIENFNSKKTAKLKQVYGSKPRKAVVKERDEKKLDSSLPPAERIASAAPIETRLETDNSVEVEAVISPGAACFDQALPSSVHVDEPRPCEQQVNQSLMQQVQYQPTTNDPPLLVSEPLCDQHIASPLRSQPPDFLPIEEDQNEEMSAVHIGLPEFQTEGSVDETGALTPLRPLSKQEFRTEANPVRVSSQIPDDRVHTAQVMTRRREMSLQFSASNQRGPVRYIDERSSSLKQIQIQPQNHMATPQKVPRALARNQYDKIVCAAYNAEPFYRRAMQRLGWHLNTFVMQKQKFHIKFDVEDLQGTSTVIKEKQLYNHFPSNREVVTKAGLCKNLWANNTERSISKCFPRCFDLSDSKQAAEFTSEFTQTAILSILKMAADYFISKNADVAYLVQQHKRQSEFANPRVFKQQLKNKCSQSDEKHYPEGGLIGSDELRLTYSYCKSLYNKIRVRDKPQRNKIMSFANQFKVRVQDEHLQELVNFQTKLADTGMPPQKVETYEQVKLVRLCWDLMEEIDQFKATDGVHNVWIVKPSYNSRGFGIYLTRQLSQIIADNKKTQQKIVQKYIERPFCINDNKKFDFRQWVLVNSWEPLDVCVFSSAYLKICSQPFSLNRLDDSNRHLSNFTINKKDVLEDQEEIVMSTDQFEELMREKAATRSDIPADFTWSSCMLPKIKQLVWTTLKSLQETQEQRGNCFEVFGFDIMLDNDLNLWLIEINLSPACSERTSWLTQMLDESCHDLLSFVQQKILVANPADSWSTELQQARRQAMQALWDTRYSVNLNPRQYYEIQKPKDRWIRLQESIQEIKALEKVGNQINEQKVELAVYGLKIKFDKRLQKNFKILQAVELIQRVWRGQKGRKLFRSVLEKKHSIVIQRHARMFLAKLQLRFLRANRSAIMVQRYLYRIIARNMIAKLRAQRLLEQQTALVIKLQSLHRRKIAQRIVHALRKHRSACLIQKRLRGLIAMRKALTLRTQMCLIIRIQRFYRKRFRQRNRASILIQKLLRGMQVKQKVNVKLRIARGALVVRNFERRVDSRRGLKGLFKHAKAISVQKQLRGFIERKKCIALLKAKAKEKAHKVFRKYALLNLKTTAKDLRRLKSSKALIIQKFTRGALAAKRLRQMKQAKLMNDSATTIQKYLRGLLGIQNANLLRFRVGAAIFIQSMWRGYKARRRRQRMIERRHKKAIRDALREQRVAEKQAREDYDPSNENLMQIFGLIKPKPPKDKQRDKLRPLCDRNTAMNKFRSGMDRQPANTVTGIHKKQFQHKLIELQNNVSRLSCITSGRQSRLMTSMVQDSYIQSEADETVQSKVSLPLIHESKAVSRLQAVKPIEMNTIRNRHEEVKIVKMNVERSTTGEGIGATVTMKKNPSKDKIPLWAAHAMKMQYESPRVLARSITKPGLDKHTLEQLYKQEQTKVKVFSIKPKLKMEVNKEASEDRRKLANVFGRDPVQQNKTKTFSQNLLDMLENQTQLNESRKSSQDRKMVKRLANFDNRMAAYLPVKPSPGIKPVLHSSKPEVAEMSIKNSKYAIALEPITHVQKAHPEIPVRQSKTAQALNQSREGLRSAEPSVSSQFAQQYGQIRRNPDLVRSNEKFNLPCHTNDVFAQTRASKRHGSVSRHY